MSVSFLRKFTINNLRRSHAQLTRFSTAAQPAIWTAVDDAAKLYDTQSEGDNWDHNFSIAEDGVVNTKLAFRNATLASIVTRLPTKVVSGKITVDNVTYSGQYTVLEAGDNMEQNAFSAMLTSKQEYLSCGKDLFFEDVGLGASPAVRIGARLISENPAHALIFRTLMINIPPRPTDHRARYNGWNLDERWMVQEKHWNGSSFDVVEEQTVPRRGERPIVAFIGGEGSEVAVQFQQQQKSSALAGANIVAGADAPIRGVLEAYGMAAAAMINSESKHSLTIPCLVLSKDGKTTVIVGDNSDASAAKAHASGSLYGAYWNVLTEFGVSAVFNGFVGPADKAAGASVTEGIFSGCAPIPVVVSGGYTAVAVRPDNFCAAANTIVFVGEKKLTADEAKAKLVALCGDDDSKLEVAGAILKTAEIVCASSAEKYIL